MIKIKEIEIYGETVREQTVSSIKKANQILSDAAFRKKDNEGYDKTWFTITWEDGETFSGRVDLTKKHIGKPITTYIQDEAKFYLNGAPYWMAQAQYDGLMDIVKQKDPDYINTWKQFLENYDIGDDYNVSE